MIDVITCNDQVEWDDFVKTNDGHPLQLWGWGEVKAAHGWSAERVRVGQGGAQLLIKRLPAPFGPLVYVPRGPVGSMLKSEDERTALVAYVNKTYQPTLLSVEPDTVGPLNWKGWRTSSNRILLARTAVLDLKKSEDELLADMTKKTRQYIRKSAKAGVDVRVASSRTEIDECLAIYKQTASRAGFALHGDRYYHDIAEKLEGNSPIYIAMYEGRVVAFLWPVITPAVAFELYGGMSDEGQALRANYHLKWSVIRAMKQRGIERYDVNGLLNDGVTSFKKGFIPVETTMSGTLDYPMSLLYVVWNGLLPAIKRVLRAIR